MQLSWIVEIFKNMSAVSVIIAGMWILYNSIRARTFRSKLLIKINTFSEPLEQNKVLFVEVELINQGKCKLVARRVGLADYVYKDKFDQLKYSCSLQVKRVNMKKLTGEAYLDWYNCSALEQVPDLPAEINLLDDNVDPCANNEVVFWMEPGDVVHLSAPLILHTGDYLLKVSFFGINRHDDYWSRLLYVQLR